MTIKALGFFIFTSIFTASLVYGTENLSEDLAGFGKETSIDLAGFGDADDLLNLDDNVSLDRAEDNNNFDLDGNLAFKTSIGYKKHKVDNVEYSGVNQAQTSLYLQLDGKLSDDWKIRVSADAFYDAIYEIRSDQEYQEKVLDDYKTQLRLDDTYIHGRVGSDIDIKAGRQIVVWGKSDNIRITDIINPTDNRLPGMTDIEDLRLSVGMLKLDYYRGQWNFSAMVIPENRIIKEATPNGEFFPIETILDTPDGITDGFPKLVTPASSWNNMQYAFAANGVFSGWDLSFYAADVLDQKWHFKDNLSSGLALSERTVSTIKMLGSAINMAYGSWLLKSEFALLNGVKYNTTSDDKNRLDILLGLEYMGIKDTVLSCEVANRHLFDYEEQMQFQSDFVDQDEMQTALRVSRSFENDTIKFTGLASLFGSSWENGGFTRVWVEYELGNAMNANLGLVEYIGGDRPYFEGIKDNDRVFADITYSF